MQQYWNHGSQSETEYTLGGRCTNIGKKITVRKLVTHIRKGGSKTKVKEVCTMLMVHVYLFGKPCSTALDCKAWWNIWVRLLKPKKYKNHIYITEAEQLWKPALWSLY